MPRRRITTVKKRPIEQYEHKDKDRVNNPPVGMVTPETDKDAGKKTYSYDPHLDPQLQWAGKAERTSFDIDTVSLHVHERIDPRSIMEAVRKKNGSNYEQQSLFSEEPKLKEVIEFYKHRNNWSNRLIAGDSLLVMNSLLEKEGLAGQVQMIYFDPPYGIKYGSNFQPFTNKRDVKDGKDEDLTAEPETIKAFRDTWELGIHSYLSYIRDRLLLARELLSDSASIFVQISDENVHHVREILDEVFGNQNFVSQITFVKTGAKGGILLDTVNDFILWYSKDKFKMKYRQQYFQKEVGGERMNSYVWLELEDGVRRKMTPKEFESGNLPMGSKVFSLQNMTSQSGGESSRFSVEFEDETYIPTKNYWKTTPAGIENLIKAKRIMKSGNNINYVRYIDDFPAIPFTNLWTDTAIAGFSGEEKLYVVQTAKKVIQRSLLMTTDPGDLVLDITCGSGTTAYVAEQWGRRWITCDTSRVAITLAKQRLMTAVFDYYELAHPGEGVGSGFRYKTVPHITLKSIANNEPPGTETLYDQPFTDKSKARVTGPFTVEAVPAPTVRSIEEQESKDGAGFVADASIAREGETMRQSEWRTEILKKGIRGKGGQYIKFSRVEPLAGTRWLHADGESLVESGEGRVVSGDVEVVSDKKKNAIETRGERVVISFGPEHAPLEQKQVALAIEEAQTLVPKPKIVVFASFQFDPEAAKDIDEMNWPGVTLLKAQMNPDMLTDDLKKKRSSDDSFWLIGSPDVMVESEEWLVDSSNKSIVTYEYFKKLSGIDSLAKINGLSREDLQFYIALSQRGDLWIDLAVKASGGINTDKHSGRTSKKLNEGVSPVHSDIEGFTGRVRDIDNLIKEFEIHKRGSFREFVDGLRANKQTVERLKAGIGGTSLNTLHMPLTTQLLHTVNVLGFDYFNTKTGNIESGGKDRIAMWLLDTDYDGRSLFPRQVFFPMAGEKEGWSKLAKNLKAEIDEELIEAFKGTISLPFPAGKYKRIAVKIVDDRGVESLKVVGV